MGGLRRSEHAAVLKRERPKAGARFGFFMPLDQGTIHRFTMLERAVRSLAKQGRFEDSLKLLDELLSLAPQDPGLSKSKVRFASELIKQAAMAQRISDAAAILERLEKSVPASHLSSVEKGLLAKAKEDLYSL